MQKTLRLDIGGPKGNAFYILGMVGKLTSKELATKIREEMKTGDYNNLLTVFKKHFPGILLYSSYRLAGVDKKLYKIEKSYEL